MRCNTGRAAVSALLLTLLVLLSGGAQAGVVINGTRVIYPQKEKNVTVQLSNEGTAPVLVQSWLDKGDMNANPQTLQVPFVLTPPINRIEPKQGQTLRISYTGQPLPTDRESVFWLNVLEIPSKPADASSNNFLQMAFRTRIKLFFRPTGLPGTPAEAAKSLRWTLHNGEVTATNASPWHVSLVSVRLKESNAKAASAEMVAPESNASFRLTGAASGKTLVADWVNDYGAIVSSEAVIH